MASLQDAAVVLLTITVVLVLYNLLFKSKAHDVKRYGEPQFLSVAASWWAQTILRVFCACLLIDPARGGHMQFVAFAP